MIIIYFLLALLLGPILFFKNRNNNQVLKILGLILWIIGWGYLGWAFSSLMRVAG